MTTVFPTPRYRIKVGPEGKEPSRKTRERHARLRAKAYLILFLAKALPPYDGNWSDEAKTEWRDTFMFVLREGMETIIEAEVEGVDLPPLNLH